MLAWHAHVGWVKGGFARMTIFFALSGYLAAASYLSLRRRGVDRAFLSFWRRRARRLLPVSLLGIAAAVTVTAWVGSEQARNDLRGDAFSVLGYVSNWRFLFNDRSYGDLFERPSAFQHFWSLSLEEQLFWTLPLVMFAAVMVARRRPWLATGLAAVTLASIPAFVAHTPDAAYYGTHVRGGEFLAGVTLALMLDRRGGVPLAAQPAIRVAGGLSLAFLVGVMLLVDRTHAWLYQGGLGLFAIPAVLVIAAALDQRGAVPASLSFEPLVRIGRWAFPIYVLHWPVFLVLSSERTGLSGAPLVVVQLATSIALGAVVHHWYEKPLMTPGSSPVITWWQRDRMAFGALALASLVLAVTVINIHPAPAVYDFAAAERLANEGPVATATGDGVLIDAPLDGVALDDRTTVALFGGSTAVMLGGRIWDWSTESAHARPVPGYSRLGCGLLTEGERIFGTGSDGGVRSGRPDPHCLGWVEAWSAAVEENRIEVAVVLVGVWDTADWKLDGEDDWLSIGDSRVDGLLRAQLERAVDVLNERGAFVVLATTPEVGPGADGRAREARSLRDDHGRRVAAFNDLVREVADSRVGATVVEYGQFIDGLGPELSAQWLPDGIHPTEGVALDIWRAFLGPSIDDVVGRLRLVLEAPATMPADG
jgi:peptidoglycan/LPS O-acetylase OafA/YrhL